MIDRKEFLALRRKVIESEFSRLNEMQRKAVMATEGPLLLLAGAGSGKTTVIINRIANLLRYGRASDSDDIPEWITEDDVQFLRDYVFAPQPDYAERVHGICALEPAEPWRVIAITFTNKAAGELRSRLEAMLGEGSADIWASTFHSACVRILRRDIEKIPGFSSSFTIYDTDDTQSLIKRILKDVDIDDKVLPPRSAAAAISAAKDAMKSAEQYAAEDAKRKEEVDVKNEADQMVYQAEKTISELGDKLDSADKAKLDEALNKVKAVKDGGDTAAIKQATEELTQAFYAVSEKIYSQNPQGAPGAQGPDAGGAAPGGQDYYDADYEVVDDDKK